jgi:hypothetical protein
MPLHTSEHYYLSTACLHQLHSYCQATVNESGEAKKAGSCKFCSAPCICPCHHAGEPIPMMFGIGD